MEPVVLTVVIPVYNSAPLLEGLHRQLCEALQDYHPLELLFVEDASTDAGADVLHGIAAGDGRVRVVSLSRNVGQQEATLCGLSLARGKYVASMDSDLEHPPALLPAMLKKLKADELDIVYAVPRDGVASFVRRLGGTLRDAFFCAAFHLPAEVRVSSYRVMTAALARRVVAERRGGFNYFSAMVFSRPTRAFTLTYAFQARTEGASSYSFLRRVRLYLRILRNYGPFAPKRKKPPVPFPIKEDTHADAT